MVRIAPRIPEKLYKDFRDYCQNNGKIMEFEIAELIRGYLERKNKEGK